MMLVLSRRIDESIVIGDNIVVKILEIYGSRVRLGIEAPSDVVVHRGEVQRLIEHDSTKWLCDSAGTSTYICRQKRLLS